MGVGIKSSHLGCEVLNCKSAWTKIKHVTFLHTGKSLSEALIFASINPQYDNRLFLEMQWKIH